jgi:hypothetical protein
MPFPKQVPSWVKPGDALDERKVLVNHKKKPLN